MLAAPLETNMETGPRQGWTMPPGLEVPEVYAGFPNPWLWPMDVSSEGISAIHRPCRGDFAFGSSAVSPEQQAAQPYDQPYDQPMKIPSGLFEASASSQQNEDDQLQHPLHRRHPHPVGEEPFGVTCRWHKSAETVGIISNDGHIFTKEAGPRRSRVSDRGARVELASICMVFDSSLRTGGVHRYCYQIMDGELGAADGAGFVFDSKVRRNNIQRMRAVFLNQRGRICLRNNQQVTKLQAQLPPLMVGATLMFYIDLDSLMARFEMTSPEGMPSGSADVSLADLFEFGHEAHLRSGFFCAVVTGSITIGIS